MCPKGNDPIKLFTGFRTITITTSIGSSKSLTSSSSNFIFRFNGQNTSFPANYNNWSPQKCESAMQKLRNIAKVQCIMGSQSNGGIQYTVKFLAFPMYPYENNIYFHNGNPALSSFYCDSSNVKVTGTSASCNLADVSVAKVPGNQP